MVTQVSREGEGDRDSQGCQGERASGATQAIRVYRASLEQKLKLANQESQLLTAIQGRRACQGQKVRLVHSDVQVLPDPEGLPVM